MNFETLIDKQCCHCFSIRDNMCTGRVAVEAAKLPKIMLDWIILKRIENFAK